MSETIQDALGIVKLVIVRRVTFTRVAVTIVSLPVMVAMVLVEYPWYEVILFGTLFQIYAVIAGEVIRGGNQ